MVVTPGLPARNVKEFIAIARDKPGRITYGLGGTRHDQSSGGGAVWISAGVKMTHVPYKGMGPATVDLMGGQIDVGFDQLSAAIAFIKSGKTRAGFSESHPVKDAARLPTLAESGVTGADASTFTGIRRQRKRWALSSSS